MLSPDSPSSRVILIVALVALIGLLVYRAVRKERTEFQRFKRFERTTNRQRMMRKWLIGSFAWFGSASLVALVLVWQYIPLLLAEAQRWPVFHWVGSVSPMLFGGVAVLLVVGTTVAVYFARNSVDIPTIGDISALLPRNRRELWLGAGLSVNAGVVEELLFRLALPALIFGVTGNAVVSVLTSVVLFGALHIYQGLPGIVGAVVIGGLLMGLYLASGSILIAIVTHALIDLRSLVLIPVLVYRVHRVFA